MADFIKLTTLTKLTSHDDHPIDGNVWLSKYHIKHMFDSDTNFTIIFYDNGEKEIEEIHVRESVETIVSMFHA